MSPGVGVAMTYGARARRDAAKTFMMRQAQRDWRRRALFQTGGKMTALLGGWRCHRENIYTSQQIQLAFSPAPMQRHHIPRQPSWRGI